MPISLQCTCGHAMQVSSFLAGKTCKCPQCSAWIAVTDTPLPAPPPRPISAAAAPRPNLNPGPPLPPPPLPPSAPRPQTRIVAPVSPVSPVSPPMPRPVARPTQTIPRDPFAAPVAPPVAPSRSVPTHDPLELQAAPVVAAPVPSVTRGRTGLVPRSAQSGAVPQLFGSARERPKPGSSAIGELRYWLLALALFPLVVSIFRPDDNVLERFNSTLKKMSAKDQAELKKSKAVDDGDDSDDGEEEVAGGNAVDKLLARMPDDRIDGAHLARNSHMQWVYALLAAGFYWGLILLLFPLGNAKASHLLMSGIFTGTIGIFFLLAVQWLAFNTFGLWIHGGGILGLIMLTLKGIAWCYQMALDPGSGFVASLIGFVFGIGLCEEVCKGMVLFYMFRTRSRLDWRGACAWGLASGVGFGVSEGISYAGGMYNGIMRYDAYLIRFISCVALHGIWSAAVGLSAYRNRYNLEESRWTILKICIVPMILHGLYDTLLKKDYPGGAVLVALCSFAWLAYQFECTYAESGTESESERRVVPTI